MRRAAGPDMQRRGRLFVCVNLRKIEISSSPDLTVDLAGKGIIVTGVGGSIALGCALARGGVSLTLNDVDPQALERIVSRMPQMGVPVLSLVGM